MKKNKVFTTLLLLLSFVFANSQTKISGTVVDSKTQKPIANADIVLPGAAVFTTSNTDGSFYLESAEDSQVVQVTASGYEFFETDLPAKVNYNFKIELKQETHISADSQIELGNVNLTGKIKKYKKKKENPAYAILQKVWENRRKNGLKAVPQYEYDEYEKLEFDLNNIDSSFTKNKAFRNLEFIFEKIDTSEVTGKTFLPLFINESIYKVYGKNKPERKERKDLIANKNSGFSDNEILIHSLQNLYKDYDIYDNRLNFFNINFVSPIARDGFSVYDYELTDTISVDGIDCFRIKYFPKRTAEHTFKGDFYVTTGGYAIKEIAMQSTKSINVNFVRDIFVSHQFEIVNDTVFYPKRDYVILDMSLLDNKDNSKGIFARKTNSYQNLDINTVRPDDFYKSRNYDPHLAGAFEKDNSFWDNTRPEQLSKNEAGIYEMLDSLQQVPKFKHFVKALEVAGSGYYNVGKAIDIGDLYSSFGYNKIEGLRLRAGARTFFSSNDMWRLAGYTAYGFRDKQFKYGAEARFMFDKYNRFQVGIGTKRDIEQMAVQLTSSEGIMTRTFASSSIISQGENASLSHINKTNVYTSIDPWKNFSIRLDGTYQTTRSADPTLFNMNYLWNGHEDDNTVDSNLSLTLIARPGAKFSNYGIDRYEHSSNAPTILLRYTKGFTGLFNSQFNYDKLQFLYTQPILVGSFGRSVIIVEAGKTFGTVPLPLLSVIPGNESYGQTLGTFSQLDYYEFVTDTYSTLIIDHHFNGWILGKLPIIKKLKLREVGFLRAAWGDLSDKNIEINRSEINYLAPKDKIYYEYGFGIENIGFGNFRPLRIDFNWRGNYLTLPDARRFGVTVGLDFSF